MKVEGGKIVIHKDLCKACGYCIVHCPKGCISEGTELNSSGYLPVVFSTPANCTGCALCALMCPEIAIEVWREAITDTQPLT